MPIGDRYHCNTCGKNFKAIITLYTKQCNSIACGSTDIIMLPPEPPIPVADPAEVPTLLFKESGVSDEQIDDAIQKIEFKESNKETKEVKRMADDEGKKGKDWGGTSVPDYDPQQDFKAILKDMGLKNKIESIAKMFYAGDIDNPVHLDEVLKTAGIDTSRRRLAVASYYGFIPDELKAKTDGDNDDEDDGKKSKKTKESDDPIKDAYKQIKLKKAEKLLELQADVDMEELEAKIEKKSERIRDKGEKAKDDIVRMPATDENGAVMKDEKGVPIILELSRGDMPIYLMSRNSPKAKSGEDNLFKELILQQNAQIARMQELMIAKAGETAKPDERALSEKKYWEEKAERERKDREEQMKEFSKQRDDFLKETYKMREEFMKKDMTDLMDAFKAANKPIEQQMAELQNKGVMAQKFGLIATGADPKTAVQTEIARGMGEEGKALIKEIREAARTGMQEGMTMVKEERRKQQGASPTVPDIAIPPGEKEAMYLKLQAKMQEEATRLKAEQERIDIAKADLDRKSNELIQKWEKMGQLQKAPEQPKPEPVFPDINSAAKELGMSVPEQAASPPVAQSTPTPVVSNIPEDPVSKKLAELENKGKEVKT